MEGLEHDSNNYQYYFLGAISQFHNENNIYWKKNTIRYNKIFSTKSRAIYLTISQYFAFCHVYLNRCLELVFFPRSKYRTVFHLKWAAYQQRRKLETRPRVDAALSSRRASCPTSECRDQPLRLSLRLWHHATLKYLR